MEANDVGRVISTALQLIDGFTKPSKQAIDSIKKLGREIASTGKQIQNVGKTITAAGSTLTAGITLPITGLATAAIKTAADFEAAMSEVGAISGSVAEEELPNIIKRAGEMGLSFQEGANATETAANILKAKTKEMGATTAFSASESAEAMKYMAMAGWKTTDMMDGIAGIMNLAAASGEDLAATSDIVTDGLTAFGMSAKESGRFADVMAAASTNANTNVSLMGESFKYCAATAGAMGYSIEDISVAIGVMANAGIKGSTAGTTLKNVIANLAKPTAAQEKIMQKLGISLTDNNGNMKSFAEVMENLRTSFSGLTETEKAAYATTLGGKESMSGLLTVVNASTTDFDKLTEAIHGAAGSAEEMAGKMLDNLNGQLTLLKSAVEGIAISIGDKLLPYIKKAVSWFQKTADLINGLSDAQVNHIIKWGGVAAAIGPAVLAFGKVVTTVGTATKTYGDFIKKIGDFKGIVGMIKSPTGVVIGILAAIAVAAILIIKNWDQVKGFLQSIGNWFQKAFENAGISVEGFKNKFTSIGITIGNIAKRIHGFCKSLTEIFQKEFTGNIKESIIGVNGILEILAGGVGIAFDQIVTAVEKGLQGFDALLEFFTGAFVGNWDHAVQEFRNTLKNMFPPVIAEGMIKTFDMILPAIKATVSGMKASFAGLVQDVKKIVEGFSDIWKGIGKTLKGIFTGDAETALNGFQIVVSGILDTIGTIFQTKINGIKNFVVGACSTFLPDGVVNKIATVFDGVIGAWKIAIQSAKDYISGFIQAMKPIIEDIETVFKGITQFVKGIFAGDWKEALEGLKNIASGVLSSFITILKAPFTTIGTMIKKVIQGFKGLDVIKSVFSSIGNVIENVLSKSGIDMNKFTITINSIKNRISSIINNLKTIFGTVFEKIGSIVKAAANVVANFFGKKINDTCRETGNKLAIFRASVGTTFQVISSAIKIAMGVIVPVVKVAFSNIKSAISIAIYTITSLIDGFLTVLDGITSFLSGVFTGNWSKAWEGIKTIFKGVFESLVALCKVPINGVISLINQAIAGINQLGFTIPEWVPGIGGKSFSVNVPSIPMLYKGTDNWQGGAAIIHDKGGEIVDLPKGTRVYPHDKSVEMARKEGSAQNKNITITIQKLADRLEIRSEEDIDRIAEALARKLKQIAFNTGIA